MLRVSWLMIVMLGLMGSAMAEETSTAAGVLCITPVRNTSRGSVNTAVATENLHRALQPNKKKVKKGEEMPMEIAVMHTDEQAAGAREAKQAGCQYLVVTRYVEMTTMGDPSSGGPRIGSIPVVVPGSTSSARQFAVEYKLIAIGQGEAELEGRVDAGVQRMTDGDSESFAAMHEVARQVKKHLRTARIKD